MVALAVVAMADVYDANQPVWADPPALGTLPVFAPNPVVSGTVRSIVVNGTTMDINQASQNAHLRALSLNLASNAHLNINQEVGVTSRTLIQVDPASGISQVYGRITAQGQLILFNRAGFVFGGTSRIDTRSTIATALDPRNVEALNNLGLALQQEEQYPAAMARYRQAAELRPGFAEALLNWGNTLKDMGDLDGASAIYANALAIRPGFAEALVNSASVALDRGNLDEARSWYRRALELDPRSADAQYGLGQIALREGRFDAGWDGYERRFETHPPQAIYRRLRQPRLAAADLGRARRVALWSEQGIGDQVLFSTLLPELERRGIKGVVEVDARLAPLYRRSLPRFEFVPPESAEEAFAGCDYELPMGSLPGLFRRDVASFAAQPRALLAADARRMTAIREQLGRGRVIGISWRSLQKGGRRALGERKSIPLEHFAPLAQATGARLLDLQYGDVTAEREQFAARHPGVLVQIDGLDLHDDLDGVAAAIACCDRVVTSSNVTAHLAGALGKATQVVYLRDWPPFSYWTPGEGGQSRWYPSVRVESDPAWTSWERALEGLAKRLAGE